MIWGFELLMEALLIMRLMAVKTNRPKFEALIVIDFLVQVFQFFGERSHWYGLGAHSWYFGVFIEIPLMALAMIEAADYRPLWHRTFLFWWISIVFGLAWVRIFPYTGTALLLVNATYFLICLIHFEVE